jgi:LacI family transcriptional regulator
MPQSATPSVRSLAKLTGFSKATVANALNGSPSVAAATVKKIRAVAAQIGYERNPMVGTLMSAMRRSRASSLRGVLAVGEIVEPDRPEHGLFHRELFAGCNACAEELGFRIEYFRVNEGGLTPQRLSSVLKARGIRGLILLPSWRTPDFSRFDWSWFAGVYADYIAETPTLNSVCCDHYRSMLELLGRLSERGYRRPGFIVEAGRDERVHLRMSAAVLAFQSGRAGGQWIEPFCVPEISAPVVADWIARERPDVVLSHHPDVLDWIQQAGYPVPERVGFVGLNVTKSRRSCAGLDLKPREIGHCAVEILIGQIQRQHWGVPRFPTNTTILGEFIDGPSLSRPSRPFSRTPASRQKR